MEKMYFQMGVFKACSLYFETMHFQMEYQRLPNEVFQRMLYAFPNGVFKECSMYVFGNDVHISKWEWGG